MAKQEKQEKAPQPKLRDLRVLTDYINKEMGSGSIVQGRGAIAQVDVFSTGVLSLDIALGCGGLPRGRIIELFGNESSGKTTTSLQFIAACQQADIPKKQRKGVAAFVDAEHALDPDWAQKCGVDMEALLISQPDSGEQAFKIIDHLATSGLIDLIVVDSVAALTPQVELDGEITDVVIGAQARLMSQGLRKIKAVCSRNLTTVVFINQIRNKIGVAFGNPEQTPGGKALKFYSSVRIEVLKGSPIKDGDAVVAFRPTAKIIKNKVAPPFTRGEYDLCVGHPARPTYGIDTVASLLEVATSRRIIERNGSHYCYNEERLGNGVAAASSTLRGNPQLLAEIKAKTYTMLFPARADRPQTNDDSILDQD